MKFVQLCAHQQGASAEAPDALLLLAGQAEANAALSTAMRQIANLPTDEERLSAWQVYWAAAANVDAAASAALFECILSAARQAEALAGSTVAAAHVAAEQLLSAIDESAGLIDALVSSAQSGTDGDAAAAAFAWSTTAAGILGGGAGAAAGQGRRVRAQPLQGLGVEVAAAGGAHGEVGEASRLEALVPGYI